MSATSNSRKQKYIKRISNGLRYIVYRNPLYPITLKAHVPTNIEIEMNDTWPGNSKNGKLILQNRLSFGGFTGPADPAKWHLIDAPTDWLDYAHSFIWLRDLRALGGDAARKKAREMTHEWLITYRQWDSKSWFQPVIGARLAAWIGNYNFFLSSANNLFRFYIFDAIVRQSKHLARTLPDYSGQGISVLLAIKGLLYCCLAMPHLNIRYEVLLKDLYMMISRQIMDDGGHIERNPKHHIDFLIHLIDIKHLLKIGNMGVPEYLEDTITVMTSVMKFFMHGDNSLALFNGSDEGNKVIIDMILNQHSTSLKTIKSLPQMGYERITAGRSMVIMDTGHVPPKGCRYNFHAAPLSFEFSVGKNRIFTNCGHGGSLSSPSPLASALRTTAAHTALVINDTNAIDILDNGSIRRRPRQTGATRDKVDMGQVVTASHDGYSYNFKTKHSRKLFLSNNGDTLKGQDTIIGQPDNQIDIRFHLHPNVKCSLVNNGEGGVLLATKGGAGWRFKVANAKIEIESSIYLPSEDAKPRPTKQIVLTAKTPYGKAMTVKWMLKREKK